MGMTLKQDAGCGNPAEPTPTRAQLAAAWCLARLEGMRLARFIANAGGALTNPYSPGSGQHAGFQHVANLHHRHRMGRA